MPDATYIAINAGSVATSIILLVIYHAWVVRTVIKTPSLTVFGLNEAARRAWVVSIMRKKQDILAVQSLRNWIMGASLLGSTAIFIVFGFVAFFSNVGTHGDTTMADNPLSGQFGFVTDSIFGFKILAILIVYMTSFFCFINAIRFFNHSALVMNITCTKDELANSGVPNLPLNLPVHPSVVAALMNRGAFFNTLGIRGYYISFPIIAYLWGPWSLLACTIIVIALMRFMDMHVDPEVLNTGETEDSTAAGSAVGDGGRGGQVAGLVRKSDGDFGSGSVGKGRGSWVKWRGGSTASSGRSGDSGVGGKRQNAGESVGDGSETKGESMEAMLDMV